MFSIARSRALHHIIWATPPHEAEYIEARRSSSDDPSQYENVAYGRLRDSEIDNWLEERAHLSPKLAHTDIVGGIRIIIAERIYFDPPSLSISRASYMRIEEQFHLPHISLQALMTGNGAFCRFEEYDEKDSTKLKRIAMIIKVPQKYQVGNYGVALSYDFSTKFTTALLVGTGIMQDGNDYRIWPKCPSAELFDYIKAVPSLLAEPMILPTILLQHHLYRTDIFCNSHLNSNIDDIQRRLGMNRAGRMHLAGPARDLVAEKPINEMRDSLRTITSELSTFMTEITWYCKVSEWQCECAAFLAQMLSDVAQKSGGISNVGNTLEYRDIKECIEYLDMAAQALRRQNGGSKERAEADIGVLYSIIAQLDNRLNAKISASSSRDSTAMKTLAFITTLFLPGTFVASVFSMSMFNWQPSASNSDSTSSSDKSSTRIVSSYFWVYWAITVPLTFLVAVSWRVWWNWEKKNFDQDVRTEIENIEEPGSWGGGRETDMRAKAGDSKGKGGVGAGKWRVDLDMLRRRKGRKGDVGA